MTFRILAKENYSVMAGHSVIVSAQIMVALVLKPFGSSTRATVALQIAHRRQIAELADLLSTRHEVHSLR